MASPPRPWDTTGSSIVGLCEDIVWLLLEESVIFCSMPRF